MTHATTPIHAIDCRCSTCRNISQGKRPASNQAATILPMDRENGWLKQLLGVGRK